MEYNTDNYVKEYKKRKNERLQDIFNKKLSFIYDTSMDRRWEEAKKNIEDHGYKWFLISLDLSKELLAKMYRIKDYKQADYAAYFGGYLGNYYLVLLFPDIWRYELFEAYAGSAKYEWPFGTDYENYNGREEYAENTAGGYYAARLSVLEKLDRLKRQGSCLCLRFITDEYWAPLGVWVVREAARNAMKSKAIGFGSKELMITYAKHLVRKKFGYDLDNILKMSKLLKEVEKQGKLINFFQ